MKSYTHNGLTFDVIDDGPRDGEILALLHGFPTNATSWDAVSENLHRAGYRTLAPDQRGYSPGARPKARRQYRLNLLVDDVVALLDACEAPRAHVVGHDWGGGVAWQMATRYSSRVQTLTSVSTPHPRAFIASLFRSKQALHSYYMLAFQIPRMPEQQMLSTRGSKTRLTQMLIHSGLDAKRAAGYVAYLSAPGALTCAINWYRALPLSKPPSSKPVKIPTLYMWGRHDEFLGETAAQLTSRFVAGPYSFEAIDASHWIPENNADELSQMIIDHIHVSA